MDTYQQGDDHVLLPGQKLRLDAGLTPTYLKMFRTRNAVDTRNPIAKTIVWMRLDFMKQKIVGRMNEDMLYP